MGTVVVGLAIQELIHCLVTEEMRGCVPGRVLAPTALVEQALVTCQRCT